MKTRKARGQVRRFFRRGIACLLALTGVAMAAVNAGVPLDWLGNLALVTVSTNSKFSNYQPAHKAQNQAARRQSLKLHRMSQVAELGRWNDEDIREHHQEMVELLRRAVTRASVSGALPEGNADA